MRCRTCQTTSSLERGSGRGNQCSLSSSLLHLSIEPLFEDGGTLVYGGPGGLPRAESSHPLARLMEALFGLPAERLLPGHTPAQLVRCLGLGNGAMLPPVSARITAAVSAAMPGIVCNSNLPST
jgi:hypothetical protein